MDTTLTTSERITLTAREIVRRNLSHDQFRYENGDAYDGMYVPGVGRSRLTSAEADDAWDEAIALWNAAPSPVPLGGPVTPRPHVAYYNGVDPEYQVTGDPPPLPAYLYTTAAAARELGISPRLVRRLATQHNIGTLLNPRLRVFTADDIATMRARNRRQGRPPSPASVSIQGSASPPPYRRP